MLLRGIARQPRERALHVGCAAGGMTTELLRLLGPSCHIAGVDPSPELLERARDRIAVEHGGRNVSFRRHMPGSRLPFDDGAFDLVLVNLGRDAFPIHEVGGPSVARVSHGRAEGRKSGALADQIAEAARVTRPGGETTVVLPLRGTWMDFVDLFAEVLLRLRRHDVLAALEADLARATPEPEVVVDALAAAGLGPIDAEMERWELVFKSAREFLYSPVIELGPLPRWKEIAGHGEPMQAIFRSAKEAIDLYFAGRAFAVGVIGGRFTARKPGP
jgi:SAM-dependent methyltransferase